MCLGIGVEVGLPGVPFLCFWGLVDPWRVVGLIALVVGPVFVGLGCSS